MFVYARAAQGSRVPLAILRKQVKDLPLKFTLDDSMAMSPAAKLSGAQEVIVSARVSESGQAMPQPGDLQGQSGTVVPGASGLVIEISQVVGPVNATSALVGRPSTAGGTPAQRVESATGPATSGARYFFVPMKKRPSSCRYAAPRPGRLAFRRPPEGALSPGAAGAD